MTKLISWNVNGLRACVKKGFLDYFNEMQADMFCVQETKLSADQIDLTLDGYTQYFNDAEKKGYSGTAIFTRIKPIKATYGLGLEHHDKEGRVITLEFDSFFLVNVYTPNAQPKLARLDYRMTWEDDFRNYVEQLDTQKPVIICGDLNVAHQEIDLKNPKTNHMNPGFSDQERKKFSELLAAGFTDTFRYFYPEQRDAYTWWSYRFNARENNAGWRIDYFCASNRLQDKFKDAKIHASVLGSDHCPVELDIQ